MLIFIRPLARRSKHKCFPLEVESTSKIEDIKDMIKKNIGMPSDCQRLIFAGKTLEDGNTLENYSIGKDSTIDLLHRLRGGSCNASIPSTCAVRFMGNDKTVYNDILDSGRLSNTYIRNTNATKSYDQLKTGTCYAHSAACAYIHTILRIPGHKPPPPIDECFKIACYNGSNGGDPEKSIRILEEHYNYGILCESTYYNPLISEVMTISIILNFTTSKEGWKDVANGSLMKKASGFQTEIWHAALMEGYDLENDCCVCKNSWGNKTASPRFNIDPLATHDHYFTKVYFTTLSIYGKVPEFIPRMIKVPSNLLPYEIDAYFMDEKTATYSSEYVCERCLFDFNYEDVPDEYTYIGYDINQWIQKRLKRTREFQIAYAIKHQQFIESKTCTYSATNDDSCLLL